MGCRISSVLLAVGMIAIATSPARAATDREILQKKVAKYAPVLPLPGKNPCVCQDGSPDHSLAGYLSQAIQFAPPFGVFVYCAVQHYDGAGNVTGTAACHTWVPLAK